MTSSKHHIFNSAEWLENSCNSWAEHYNFMLSLKSLWTDAEMAWFEDQMKANMIYDV